MSRTKLHFSRKKRIFLLFCFCGSWRRSQRGRRGDFLPERRHRGDCSEAESCRIITPAASVEFSETESCCVMAPAASGMSRMLPKRQRCRRNAMSKRRGRRVPTAALPCRSACAAESPFRSRCRCGCEGGAQRSFSECRFRFRIVSGMKTGSTENLFGFFMPPCSFM